MQRLVDLVVSAFTAHADAASNPFLNADAVVAAPAAVNTAVEPAVKSEKVRLPNPGKFSDYARESRVSLDGPNMYDGGKLVLAKRFLNEKKMFAAMNTFHLGSTESQEPATYELDLQYQEESAALITKFIPAMGVMQGQVFSKVQGNDVQAQFQLMPAPHPNVGSISVHVPGRGCESSITTTTHGTLSLAHMQSLTTKFAAGLQMDHAWKEGKTLFTGAARYVPAKNEAFSVGVSPVQNMHMVDASYARTFQTSPTESVVMSATARVVYETLDSTAQVGVDMTRNESHMQMSIDSRFTTNWSYTERIAGDLLSLTVNASMSHADQAYKFGVGFECNL